MMDVWQCTKPFRNCKDCDIYKCNDNKNKFSKDENVITVKLDINDIQQVIEKTINTVNANKDLINLLAENGVFVYKEGMTVMKPIKEILHDCTLAYLNLTR